MNPFIISEITTTKSLFGDRTFPLRRAEELQHTLAQVFSRYLGSLQADRRFEAESILVTGLSGTGKTQEITDLIGRFNASEPMLPSGMPARFVDCLLDGKGSWKDLGKKTLRALGYPIKDGSRKTQTAIWDQVIIQAKEQGVVGIFYDETQHIFRDRSDAERLATLDSFKTLMKSHDWPLLLILGGIPELAGYIKEEPQLFRLMTQVRFEDIRIPEDYQDIHEIVGSYAVEAGLQVAGDLHNEDFYKRLATAGAFRWGLVINIAVNAILSAVATASATLELEHFVDTWAEKTNIQSVVSPFTHESYETIFRRDRPFQAFTA